MKKHLRAMMSLLIIFLSIGLGLYKINDNDTWWHLKVGEWIVKNKALPTHDMFSWYGIENHLPWVSTEWVSDVIFYGISRWGLVYLIIFIEILFIFFVWYNLKDYRKAFADAKDFLQAVALMGWVFLFIFLAAGYFVPRPQAISFLLFSFAYKILWDYRDDAKDWLNALPVICLLIVNLHGGLLLNVLLLMLLFLLSGWFNFSYGNLENKKWPWAKRMRLLKVFLLSLLTATLNPMGIKIFWYALEHLGDSRFMDKILEWKSPDFHSPYGITSLIAIFLVFGVLFLTEKKINLLEAGLLFLYLGGTLIHQRIFPFFLIAVTPIYLKYLTVPAETAKESVPWAVLATRWLTVILLGIFCCTLAYHQLEINKDKTILADEVIEKIIEIKPKRLYNHYNFGGYLIYAVTDYGIYPFFDGRADLYANNIFEDGSAIGEGKKGYPELIEKYQFDALLLPANSGMVHYLTNHQWIKVYEDDTCVLLKKKQPQ